MARTKLPTLYEKLRIKLPSADGTDAFVVQDKYAATKMRVGSDGTTTVTGNTAINGTLTATSLVMNGVISFSGGTGPFCMMGNTCPTGWVDRGAMGIIIRAAAACPYGQGVAYNGLWNWCHPRLCCNQ